jgi:hypothetical protein
VGYRSKTIESFEVAAIGELVKFHGNPGINAVELACKQIDELAGIYERKNLPTAEWREIATLATLIKNKMTADRRVSLPSFVGPWGN